MSNINAFAKPGQFRIISADAFSNGSSFDAILSQLGKDITSTKPGSRLLEAAQTSTASEFSMDRVQRFISILSLAEGELETFEKGISSDVARLKKNYTAEEEEFKAASTDVEAGLDAIRGAFKELEASMGRVSQTAVRIGDRLQSADSTRKRALAWADDVAYLAIFSRLKYKNGPKAFSKLPEVFLDDDSMLEAATLATALTRMASEALAGFRRVTSSRDMAAQGAGDQQAASRQGSVSHCVAALNAYTNWLEERTVQRFSEALSARDVYEMATSAAIMNELGREEVVVKIYISTLSFFGPDSSMPRQPASDGADISKRLAPLLALYSELATTIEVEQEIMGQIFSKPKEALHALVFQVLENRVSSAIRSALPALPSNTTSVALSFFLRVLQTVYGHTAELVGKLVGETGAAGDVQKVLDTLFEGYLSTYPEQELELLGLRVEEELRLRDSDEVSEELAHSMLEWNREAVERCEVLAPPDDLANDVALLFDSTAGAGDSNPGCLLDQLARHMIVGVEYAVELCESQAVGETVTGKAKVVPRGVDGQAAAQEFVNTRCRKVLEAVHGCVAIMTACQQHYCNVVVPRLSSSPPDLAACSSGVLALARAVEETVAAALTKVVTTVMDEVEVILLRQQRPTDFCPPPNAPQHFDRPTGACLSVCALVGALHSAALKSMEGENLKAFLARVGTSLHATLLRHMTRHVFSSSGALRWKSDVSEYTEVVRALGQAEQLSLLESLAALSNILLVAPPSLVGLVDGALRLEHAEALKFIKLREDFNTARVDGRTLQQLFSKDADAAPSAPVGKK